jgi:hypothetical protein
MGGRLLVVALAASVVVLAAWAARSPVDPRLVAVGPQDLPSSYKVNGRKFVVASARTEKTAPGFLRGYIASYDQGVRGNALWVQALVFRTAAAGLPTLRKFVGTCDRGAVLRHVNVGTDALMCSYTDSHGLPSYAISWQRAGVVSDLLIFGFPATAAQAIALAHRQDARIAAALGETGAWKAPPDSSPTMPTD